MDYLDSKYSGSLFLLVFVTILLFPARESRGQSSYELMPAPDIWYNSVDGIRIGGRLKGGMSGTFGEGPHRLNMGVWIGTKFPENPVSYYISFTEPIPGISEFGSEGNIRLETSFRTGFQSHGISFNKRWQKGFDERNYKELTLGFRAERRFDSDYLLYPQIWQNSWLNIAFLDFVMTDELAGGRYLLDFSSDINTGGSHSTFAVTEISFQHRKKITDSFSIFGRLYSGFATKSTAPEYLYMHSIRPGRAWMNSGLTRARGTIPPSWIESAFIQVGGGPNLRGYLQEDILSLNAGFAPLYTSLSSVNLEVDYPNPIDHAINNIPFVGEFVDLRSYLFYDAGTSLGLTKREEDRILSDAGIGFLFSINIPDYLGKPRGINIRYDLPLWLSHPGTENHVQFRHLLGIGAVIAL